MAADQHSEFKIVRTVLICIFSIAIVTMGAKELHRKHFAKVKSAESDPKVLVSELRGDLDLKKLLASPQEVQAEVARRTDNRNRKVEDLGTIVKKLVP